MPPLSGTFNNQYYVNGMGCPIRSEIWACINPGNADLAVEYAWKDGIIDHGLHSIEGESLFTAVETEAFFCGDIEQLLKKGMKHINDGGVICKLVMDILNCYHQGHNWQYNREMVINNYGHPDCTNVFQNIGFTIIALLYGKGDFIESTMTALNCGFDTDCSCATAGAVLGIINGAEKLMKQYGLTDCGYRLGVDIKRRSYLLSDLAEDTCRVGLTLAKEMNTEVEIKNQPEYVPIPVTRDTPALEFGVDYQGLPSIGLGEEKQVVISLENHTNEMITGVLGLSIPDGWTFRISKVNVTVYSNQRVEIILSVKVPAELEKLDEINMINICLTDSGNKKYNLEFGIAGAAVWKLYGPFWDNSVHVPDIPYWEHYTPYMPGKDLAEKYDSLRKYVLNNAVDINKQYMDESTIWNKKEEDLFSPAKNGIIINTHEDKFRIDDYLGFQGPCVVYMTRYLYAPEDRQVGVLVGHTDAFRVWINDVLVSKSDDPDWWTAENKHLVGISLKKGVNRVLIKLARRSSSAEFSIIFNRNGLISEHYPDFSSINPNCEYYT